MKRNKNLSEKRTSSKPRRQRKATVTLVGLLLLLQAVFLFALFPALVVIDFVQRPEAHLVMFFPEGQGFTLPQVEVESFETLNILFHFSQDTITIPGRIVTAMAFSALAAITLLAGLLFLATWRPAWALALLVQVVLLGLSLVVYFLYRHPYVYLVMSYSIFLVFYLNHYEIQFAFYALRTKRTNPET